MERLVIDLYPQLFSMIEESLDLNEETDFETDEEITTDQPQRSRRNRPGRSYVRNTKAMAATLADVKEYPDAYVFVLDMPGCKGDNIKIRLVNGNMLSVTGKRGNREEEKEGVKYLNMERRVGRFLKKFALPENANKEAISAKCEDGVLTVTVPKSAPPESKKPRTIEIEVA